MNTHPATQTASNESAQSAAAVRSAQSRTDQFCVYNTSGETTETDHQIAAFIIEYKSSHKLRLDYIYAGLQNMNLDDVIQFREQESSQDQFHHLVAAAITQVFSYMIHAELKYKYVCMGKAFIFLQVPDDSTMIYYFLSVSKSDVEKTTG